MHTMPQNQNTFRPRKGQQDLIEYLPNIKKGGHISIQWPTGYGKSIGFAQLWKHCYENKICDRLLLVVANDAQRKQIFNDFAFDCRLVGAPYEGNVIMFVRDVNPIKSAKSGAAKIFVTTIHNVEAANRGGVNTFAEILNTAGTGWMIGFDEYHHYGEGMAWGDAVKSITEYASFTASMSATPYRRGVDTVFPAPGITRSYTDAVKEGAVKRMICQTYEYSVAVVMPNGDVVSYTTSDLMTEVREDLDVWQERKQIRMSPQYIHPLITNPVSRLMEKRAATGKRLQMLVRAMSCEHAKMVCSQITTMAGHLSVDWIGTGDNGRSDDENAKAMSAFCPRKKGGVRPEPTLDVLVQVGMAGEGFDSINVAEIVDLFPVSSKAENGRATQDKQFYGRGSRIIPGANDVPLHVNVPTDHPLSQWSGKELHLWMDSCGKQADPRDANNAGGGFDLFYWPPLPRSRQIELLQISKDDPHFVAFKTEYCKKRGWDPERDEAEAMAVYKHCYEKNAQIESAQAEMSLLRDRVAAGVKRLALIMAKQTDEISGAIIGRFEKQINGTLKAMVGTGRSGWDRDDLITADKWLEQNITGSRK